MERENDATIAADPVFRAQMQVTREVLDEIGTGDVPWILRPQQDRQGRPDRSGGAVEGVLDALLVSAKDPADVRRGGCHPALSGEGFVPRDRLGGSPSRAGWPGSAWRSCPFTPSRRAGNRPVAHGALAPKDTH
jgi:hypothetical protein